MPASKKWWFTPPKGNWQNGAVMMPRRPQPRGRPDPGVVEAVLGDLSRRYELYLFVLPALLYFLIFRYYPMYGVQIAFRDFSGAKGFLGSPWVGLKHFYRFFNSFQFWIVIRNTLGLSFYQLVGGFPVPIILALSLNQVMRKGFKKVVQTVTYAPHFISVVTLAGMVLIFLSPTSGPIPKLIGLFGIEPPLLMARPEWFKTIYVASGIWQDAGWSAIVYLAALAAINLELHEAAIVDGATKLQRVRHIDIPGIMPTAVVLLILNMGSIMSVGFEKAFLMQNNANLDSSEIIATYVYKVGLLGAQYSFSTAVGLFNSVINLVLIVSVNRLARSLSDTSLW